MSRIADYGVHVGSMERGRLNKITDVPGVRVGHATINDPAHHTGVTVIEFKEREGVCVPRILTYSNDAHIYGEHLPTHYNHRVHI